MKLMIVEDEKLCLDTLLKLPYSSVGVEILDTARSGQEAMEKIMGAPTPPDIVLSDIEMSNGDGFTLAERLLTFFPKTKIIFLTAYDKIEYAQRAIHYKAHAFILKPINSQNLLKAILDAKTELECEIQQQNKYQQIITDFSNCKYFLKNYFISSAGNGEIDHMFEVNDDDYIFQSVIVTHFDKAGTMLPLSFSMFLDITALLEQSGFCFIPFYEQDMLTYIALQKQPAEQSAALANTFNMASLIKNHMEYRNDTCSFTVTIGSATEDVKILPLCDQRAREAIKYRFSIGENEMIYIDDIEPGKLSSNVDVDKYKKSLSDAIKIGNAMQAWQSIHLMFANMQQAYVSIDIVQRVCFDLIIMMSITVSEMGENPDLLFDKTEIWSVLKNYHSLPTLEEFISHIADIAISVISTSRDTKNNDIVNQIKNFIDSNAEADLSLETIADRFYISPCYLSSLFKNKTGTSYKNYTIQTKMNAAKKLLINTELPIYEVALKLGYKSPHHFSHIFQSHTGLLPTEFRNQHRTNNV